MPIRSIKAPHSATARWLLRTGLAYAVLVAVSFWLPFGLHRVIMGRRDWWHLPIAYMGLAAGAVVWIAVGRNPVAVMTLLVGGSWYFYLLITDLATLWAWHWPFESTVGERVEALDRRLDLSANLRLLAIIALAMLWLARVAR